MSLITEAPPVTLRIDEDGVMRVGQTRVPIDTVVFSFNEGASPEEIVLRYTTLDLADVYAVVNYYLHNKAEVDEYISGREAEGARIRAEMEKRFPPEGIRARLLARRQNRKAAERS
ncbi:MAG: DUF433 domain-containing protein [Acidobacteriota bacterium]|nr:DUF433 domain-containing protein [Acidobacteriota bacterium]